MIIKDEARPKGTGLSQVTTNPYNNNQPTIPRQRLAGKPKHGAVRFAEPGVDNERPRLVSERVAPLKAAPLRETPPARPTPIIRYDRSPGTKRRSWLRRVTDTPLGMPYVLLILALIACALLLLGYAM